MNEDCSKISCPVPNNQVQDYLQQYNLNQVIIKNTEFSTVINGIPITIPAGTFEYPITEGGSFFSPLTYRGCQSLISVPIPVGSTFAQIQALVQGMLQQAAEQQAQCNAANAPNAHQPPSQFLNTQQSAPIPCSDGGEFIITGTLPTGVTFDGNDLICATGIFSSNTSQDNANQRAEDFLASIFVQLQNNGQGYCQWWNDEETVTCGDGSTQTVPAHTYSSTVSKQDANDQAIAAAQAECPPPPCSCPDGSNQNLNNLTWTFNQIAGSGSGAIVNMFEPPSDSPGDRTTATSSALCIETQKTLRISWIVNSPFPPGALGGADICFNGSTNPSYPENSVAHIPPVTAIDHIDITLPNCTNFVILIYQIGQCDCTVTFDYTLTLM